MKNLWAPWRVKYIQSITHPDDECVFCKAPQRDKDKEMLILYRGRRNFIIMNKFPYNNGHMMVVPYVHMSSLDEQSDEGMLEMWQLARDCKKALSRTLHCDGANLGMNLGRVAGAGIDQHIHLHIVPRWNGDTNFMPVIHDTKVISQGMDETYDLLCSALQEIAGTS
ncbi:MAG: HIT domain-containing protein [Chitinivibrionales bacterium]|nr:HIT domain-containing protein [Chitinivibrionales bacterium]